MKKFDDNVREFITAQIENVELDGLCPICGTGRSQDGECWRGHIVINVRRPTQRALDWLSRAAKFLGLAQNANQ